MGWFTLTNAKQSIMFKTLDFEITFLVYSLRDKTVTFHVSNLILFEKLTAIVHNFPSL